MIDYILDHVRALESAWGEEADHLAELGVDSHATLLRYCAGRLGELCDTIATRSVDPETAARISRYSPSQLRRLRREGRLSGTGGFRLCELPVRPRDSSPPGTTIRKRKRRPRRER